MAWASRWTGWVASTCTAPPAPATSHHPRRLRRTFNGVNDAFVKKLNAAGSALAYSTSLGKPREDRGVDIAVRGGRAYVTGSTDSTDYPTLPRLRHLLQRQRRRLRDQAANR